MMRTSRYHFLPVAVSPALKPLNILGLELPSSHAWDRPRYAWAAVLFTTKLTSISGLITISPEGGS